MREYVSAKLEKNGQSCVVVDYVKFKLAFESKDLDSLLKSIINFGQVYSMSLHQRTINYRSDYKGIEIKLIGISFYPEDHKSHYGTYGAEEDSLVDEYILETYSNRFGLSEKANGAGSRDLVRNARCAEKAKNPQFHESLYARLCKALLKGNFADEIEVSFYI